MLEQIAVTQPHSLLDQHVRVEDVFAHEPAGFFRVVTGQSVEDGKVLIAPGAAC